LQIFVNGGAVIFVVVGLLGLAGSQYKHGGEHQKYSDQTGKHTSFFHG
jgi:hypothetical protein